VLTISVIAIYQKKGFVSIVACISELCCQCLSTRRSNEKIEFSELQAFVFRGTAICATSSLFVSYHLASPN